MGKYRMLAPGGGHGNPLQYSCLEESMDRGAWWTTVYRVTKSQTWLKQLSTAHSETSKVFTRRKKRVQYMWIVSWADSERESPLSGSQLLLRGIRSGVSFGQSFWFTCFWVYIWYISGSPYVYMNISQSRYIPPKRPRGCVTPPPFFYLQGAF